MTTDTALATLALLVALFGWAAVEAWLDWHHGPPPGGDVIDRL